MPKFATWIIFPKSLVVFKVAAILFGFGILSTQPHAHAISGCMELLTQERSPSLGSDQLAKWLEWDISPTLSAWQQERPSSPIEVVRINGNLVEVEVLNDLYTSDLDEVLNTNNLKFPWFKHPYNKNAQVPHYAEAGIYFALGHHTASRSMVLKIKDRLVGIKMPTNFPMGPNRALQHDKARMADDLKTGLARSKMINEVDKRIGPDSSLIIQKEIASVKDKSTGNGYSFRDMTPLADGHYYLPGHQIPYVGREIAIKLGVDPDEFWKIHWARAIGRLQAKLLYRYGIEVISVNPQNFLVQLDANLRPTGRIVWRDVADSDLIKPIASQILSNEFLDRDMAEKQPSVRTQINLDDEGIYWNFNKQTRTIESKHVSQWSRATREAYVQELEEVLGISIPKDKITKLYLNRQLETIPSKSELITAVSQWHKRATSLN